MRRITLLTDFGTRDGYAGAMKGVLAARVPGVLLDDITHDIPPGAVRKGSLVLGRCWRLFPEGTVHLAVVDPGVGTGRRALAAEAEGRLLVAPDNGVLSHVLKEARRWRCVSLEAPELLASPLSPTFHGRDLLAPAAALLALGVALEALGPGVTDPVLLADPVPEEAAGWLRGEVVEVDRFGNLATNLTPEAVAETGGLEMGGEWIPFRTTYGEVEPGAALSLLDSHGRVEVAVREGSAAERYRSAEGTGVRVPRGEGRGTG